MEITHRNGPLNFENTNFEFFQFTSYILKNLNETGFISSSEIILHILKFQKEKNI